MRRAIKSVLILALAGFILTPNLKADINKPTLKEYFYLGQYYLQVGKPEKAIKNYEELINKHPSSREAEKAWLAIGDAYVSLLKTKQAELKPQLGQIEKYGLTGEIKILQAQEISLRRKALSAYQTVADNFPGSAGLAQVRIGKVYAFHSPGKEEAGRVIFREVMNNFPEEAGRAALFLGDAYFSQEKFEEAKDAYYQARFFYPEVSAPAQVLFSRMDRELEDFSSAVKDLALVLNILGIDGHFTGYRYQGSIMQEAIELTAESMIAEGNPQFAIEHLKNIINRYPDTNIAFHTQLYLADIYAGQGKTDSARRELNRLISNYPQSLYATRAYLKKAGIVSDEESLTVYESLRKAFPGSKFWVIASRGLARKCLELAKKTSEAKEKSVFRNRAAEATKEIIRKYPRSPEADQARDFLKANKL